MQAFNGGEDLGLARADVRLVNAVGVSDRELTILFNERLRLLPEEYWRQLRLKAAHWMVINSSRSFTPIAYECGLTDSSHLIHWFKRACQVTLSRLRSLRKQLGPH
ncbi:helix-turn-helix domain-containing protein [Pseudomonas sp. JZ134]|uniref:helix-turn-helix domain-containing protein n=1 Tax=Pseudomonas sp. JZ134 TaxID=2806615 RepID=UPI003DA01469